jgi:hypothetical protein
MTKRIIPRLITLMGLIWVGALAVGNGDPGLRHASDFLLIGWSLAQIITAACHGFRDPRKCE